MQHLISWEQYIVYSGLGLLVYYAFIALKFYRKELLNFKIPNGIQKKWLPARRSIPNEIPAKITEAQTPMTVHAFSDELTAMLGQLAVQHATKAEIIQSIDKLLSKFPSLKASSAQPGVSRLIRKQIETQCTISVSEEELASLWN